MKILITGAAGFIGSNLCETLSQDSTLKLIGLDSLNTFYNPEIKKRNIQSLKTKPHFTFHEGSLLDTDLLDTIFSNHKIDSIIHLAAYAGVRPSIQNPKLYYDHNITGTLNLLECCKKFKTNRVLFASSSSIYGNNEKVPFSEKDPVDHPISPYAATKKACELMCYNYHHLYDIEIACIRFFTVYGPRQRPEMAIHKFTHLIENEQEIPVFNEGNCLRDYTYIDDIIQGLSKAVSFDSFTSEIPFEIFNLGNNSPVSTWQLVQYIEKYFDKECNYSFQNSSIEVKETWANINKSEKLLEFVPTTEFSKGMESFLDWFKSYKQIK